MMNELKIWVNKVKETPKANEYNEAGTINIDIKYKGNLSSNIRDNWYKLGVKVLPPIYEDLFILSLVTFGVDKRVPRKVFPDAWTRKIKVSVPVIELETWNSVNQDLNRMISYLSGDVWDFEFRECDPDSNYMSTKKRNPRTPEGLDGIRAVSLFSGGLDSFCGAQKLLSENTATIFVGFQEYGPLKGLQSTLLSALQRAYPGVFCDLFSFTAVARSLRFSDESISLESENTSRSRSFLFLSAALSVAGIVGDGVPVYIPENGFIGLNLPMTPSRLGSCSTRTTHPYFLRLFNSLLEKVGINHNIINPYAFNTKREMVQQFMETQVFKENYYKTISCSHPCNGRWDGYPVPNNCGYCYPCLIRQSSLLDIEPSNESYGHDVLRMGYLNTASETKRSDLEDLLSSIVSANESNDNQLRKRIALTGKLTHEDIERFLRLYRMTVSDLKHLLCRNKDYQRLLGE